MGWSALENFSSYTCVHLLDLLLHFWVVPFFTFLYCDLCSLFLLLGIMCIFSSLKWGKQYIHDGMDHRRIDLT